jgi:hypothetical protein
MNATTTSPTATSPTGHRGLSPVTPRNADSSSGLPRRARRRPLVVSTRTRGRADEVLRLCRTRPRRRRGRGLHRLGAALCLDHAHVTPYWLTRTAVINRTLRVEPPTRAIRCGLCQQAHDAATGHQLSEAHQ